MKRGKKLTKFISFCLTLLLTMGMMSTAAFAVPKGIVKDIGTITVSGAENNLTVSAYKIMEVDFDYKTQQPNDPEYMWVDGVADWVDKNFKKYIDTDQGNVVTEAFSKATTEEVAEFYDKLAAAIKGGKEITGLTPNTAMTNETGSADINGLPMGNYLILIENGMNVYRPSAVNLVPEWKGEEWVMTSPAEVKLKSTPPYIKKDIIENDEPVDSNGKGIGDTVDFRLVSRVPVYPTNAIAKGYEISDKLSKGLTLKADTIKIYGTALNEEGKLTGDLVELTSGTHYTLTTENAERPTGDDKSVTFNIEFKYDQIKDYDGIVVKYSAEINKDVKITDGENNNAFLDYNNNPYDDKSWETDDDKKKVYSYEIDVMKVDKNEKETLLAGAEFVLSTSKDEKDAIGFIAEGTNDGKYRRPESTEEKTDDVITTLVVGSTDEAKGKLALRGLKPGEYYLIETKAPDGYNKLSAPVEVIIKDSNNNGKVEDKEEKEGQTGIVSLTVENGQGFTLPETGGMGTVLFTAGGILLMGTALVLILVMRKKRIGAEK